MSDTLELIEVQANAGVLGLRPGDRVALPIDTPELRECIEKGLVSRLDGGEPLPPPPRPRGCGCGG